MRAYETIDPDNRLLWRANVRRLDFEAMRDSLLVMSGKLDATMGGLPVNLTEEPYSYRRSIYGYVDRGNLPELMQSFDFSNPSMPNSKRTHHGRPPAGALPDEQPDGDRRGPRDRCHPEIAKNTNTRFKIYYIYRTVFQRAPTGEETERGLKFLTRETSRRSERHGVREGND